MFGLTLVCGPSPIGDPALEDKILQRAVTTLLTEIYEQVFYACSHGFRRKRSAHHTEKEIRPRAYAPLSPQKMLEG